MIRLRPLLIALAALLGLALAFPAAAQISVNAPVATPDLGKMIAVSGTTTFSIALDGTVTRTGGTGVRLSSGGVTTPTVTLTCGLLNLSSLCALRRVRVTVTPISGSGPANVTTIRVGSISGATVYGAAPVPGSIVTFDLNPMGLLSPVSFKVGMDVAVTPGAVTGAQAFQYMVTADFLP